MARRRGLKLAAKLTGIGGLTLALTGAVDARADDTNPEQTVNGEMPSGVQVNGGNCGCAPCWGPPAPPVRGCA